MANWWDGQYNERYWCEVTDRKDLGADLKAPQKDEAGQDYWSYSLIEQVLPGDIVFHYSTREKAFVGASVAGGPMEQRSILWAPHGTSGRTKSSGREERPGFWRPLYGYRRATSPLPLTTFEEPAEAEWLQKWRDARKDAAPLLLPLQFRSDGLRAGQGYLFKMPADFVEHWIALRELAEALDERAEQISEHVSVDQSDPTVGLPGFHPKNEADYTAIISAKVQHRTRTHEKLVRLTGEWLEAHGVVIANRHPKDLEIISPVSAIVEAKVVGRRDPLFAVREALGQLHEYRHFIGPHDAELAILLDIEPTAAVIRYVENHLHMAMLWLVDAALSGGPLAQARILNAANEIVARDASSRTSDQR